MVETVTTTSTATQERSPDLGVWLGEGESSYADVKRQGPLIEESVTPLSPGARSVHASILSGGDVVSVDVSLEGRFTGVSVIDPAYVGFILPLSHSQDYVLNGVNLPVSSLSLMVRAAPLYIRGGSRRTLGIVVPAGRLATTVAALRGVDEDSVRLSSGLLRLPTSAMQATRDRLVAITAASGARASGRTGSQWAEEVLAILIDALLQSEPNDYARSRRSTRSANVVRRAEERFLAAAGNRVSLADLCRAADVGSTALYEAFERVCGESPLAYLRKRQLTHARLALLNGLQPERGAIKRAALNAGLTHLGRFSVEYRELFGESPSTTLSKLHL